MKFICTDEDHRRIEDLGITKGMRKAETMIEALLRGENLMMSLGEDELGFNMSRPLIESLDGHTVWFRLMKRLKQK